MGRSLSTPRPPAAAGLLSDSWRMTALAYQPANKEVATALVEQFLRD